MRQTAAPSPPPGIEELRPESTALFLDCDGTLAGIVERPDEARVEREMLDLVGALAGRSGGAVAVISGRSIAQLDRMLAPLKLPVAGVHGAERRDAEGTVHQAAQTQAIIGTIARSRDFVARRPGLICEEKPGSVALHYRTRPELAGEVAEFAARLAHEHPELRLLRGKMVVEIAGSRRTKGDAVADFMREPPFAGRVPVFVGDDVTDEDGFAAVARMHGIGIRIGPGETRAAWRLANIAACQAWLASLRARWDAFAAAGRAPTMAKP